MTQTSPLTSKPAPLRLADRSLEGLTHRDAEQVRARMKLITALLAAFFVVGGLMIGAFAWLLDPSISDLAHPVQANKPVMLSGIVISVLAYVVVRRVELSTRALVNLAVVYEIVLGLVIGFNRHSIPQPVDVIPIGFSPACIIIVLFPLVVPNTPKRTFFASILTAFAEVVAFVYWQAAGAPTPDPMRIFTLLAPNFLCVVLALATSRILARMERDVEKARELGSYRLVEKLGQGGMGEVWRGQHHMLARPAAIKLVKASSLGQSVEQAEQVLSRFEREAQATALLHSPHTIDIFDFGYTADGAFYYVMEMLDGLDLDTLVEQHGPLPAERVAHVLLQVCDSLEDAHQAGLVHRDIKPANVYLCRYGHRVDFAKVLDFGLVKLSTDLGESARKLTADGAVAGTPAFIAPELVTSGDAVDPRADLYALGCVAFWLLTGHLVFEAQTPMQMILKHVQDEPAAPSTLTELEIPEPLERVVLDCLAKDPAARPQSAADLARRVTQTGLAGGWTDERARQWWAKHAPTGQSRRSEAMRLMSS